MASVAIIVFARKLAKKLRREAHRCAGEKWKTRTSRLLQKFILTCGGEAMPGVVGMFDKLVRTDYLKSSLRLLCRDLPSKHTFFYKALPVKVDKWVEALCMYDIDTFTPRSWSMKHAEPRDLGECAPFAELSIYNETPEYLDFFTTFKQRLKHVGVRAREFDSREDYEASLRFFRARGAKNAFGCAVEAGDRLAIEVDDTPNPSPGAARPLVPVTAARPLRPLVLRPSDDDLAVEDVLGIVVREGELVGVGSGTKLLALYAKDKAGTLVKSFGDETFAWKQIVDRISGVAHSLWVMSARCEGYTFAEDVRTAGVDVPLTLVPGVSTGELANARFTGERRFAEICTQAAANVSAQLREAVHRRGAIPLRAQGSDLVRQITIDLKERGPSRDSIEPPQAAGLTIFADTVPIMPVEKAVPAFNVPKLCRNAWVTADGVRVEVVDSLQRDMLLERVRLLGAKRCPGCPPDHPDPLRTERLVCSAPQCPSKFLFYTTMTHLVYRKASGRAMEEDINLPLFSDQVLHRLSRV